MIKAVKIIGQRMMDEACSLMPASYSLTIGWQSGCCFCHSINEKLIAETISPATKYFNVNSKYIILPKTFHSCSLPMLECHLLQ